MQCLGEIAAPNEVRQSFQEFTNMNASAVQIKEALGKHSYRDDAAAQNRPHQQSALLDVIDHAGFCNALSLLWQGSNQITLVLAGYVAGPLIAGFYRVFLARVMRERYQRRCDRSEEHTSELQSHSFISYAVFCLKKKKT